MCAGAINALAGGGSILTFPALIAAGLPPLTANVTNTVALFPGYVGGVIGQARDLKGQSRRLLLLMPAALLGGLLGGSLILASSERLFQSAFGLFARVVNIRARQHGLVLGDRIATLPI